MKPLKLLSSTGDIDDKKEWNSELKMNHKKTLDRIYFKLLGLDFDNLNFINHIALDEIIAELNDLREQIDSQDVPPPIPADLIPAETNNMLLFKRDTNSSLLKVMILDEDIEIQTMMKYSMQGESQVEIISQRSPLEALRFIEINRPDIIMLDVKMKEMSCYDFVMQLKAFDTDRKIEIIIGSNNPNHHEKNAAFDMGAVDYITKPYDLSEVRFKIKLRLQNKKKLCG